MVILITGSSGFIGSKIIQKLKEFDHEIIEADIQNGFDILNFDNFKLVKKFDICIHLAALTFVPNSYNFPRDYFSLNINGLINCLDLCRIYDAKLIFPSTYVYGIPRYLPINEKHPTSSMNPYAESKLLGEQLCKAYNKYFNVNSIILRPSNIYGPNQDPRFLIPEILKQAKNGKITLKDPKPKRDFIFVDDIADCIIKLVEDKNLICETFNIGYGKSYSVRDIVNIVNDLFNNKLIINYINEIRKSEIEDNVLEISKIKKLLSWSPKISLHKGLKILVNG